MFVSTFPILTTPNLQRALGFYRDLLDGRVVYRFPADGDAVYVGLDVGSAHVGLSLEPETSVGRGGQRFALWVYAEDCDAAVERLRRAGVRLVEEPADQPWGERVARVLDPEGNEIIIGAPPLVT